MAAIRKAKLIPVAIIAVWITLIVFGGVALAQGRNPFEDQPGYKREYVGTFETGYTVIETINGVESSRPATERETVQFRIADRQAQLAAVRDQLAAIKADLVSKPSANPEVAQLQQAVIALSELIGQ